MNADIKSLAQPLLVVLGACTSLREKEAVFGDVLCSLHINALLHYKAGAEIKDLSLRVLHHKQRGLRRDRV